MKVLKVLLAMTMILGLAFPDTAPAAAYPDKPIQVFLPAAPGGDTDTTCRLVGMELGKILGKPLIVRNVTGAGGSTATKQVLTGNPDGYTALFFHASTLLNQIFKVTPYGIEEFEQGPIVIVDYNSAFIVKKDSRFKDLKDLAAELKKNSGTINYGTETGSFTYLQGVAFETLAGGKFNHVDVGSQAGKNTALEGRQVEVIAAPAGIVKGFLDSGSFRLLGIMADNRTPFFKDTPTFKEQGFDMVIGKPYFFLFPKGTPADVIATFDAAVAKAVQAPAFAKGLEKYGVLPGYISAKEARPFLQNIQKQFQGIVDGTK